MLWNGADCTGLGMERPTRRGLVWGFAGLAVGASLPGCAARPRGSAVPSGRSLDAQVLGLPNARFRPESGIEPFQQEVARALERQRASYGLGEGAMLPQLKLLSVSGGGENGAFGAGLLCGWTEAGNRPEFDLVTGVSTGALTAPFAFLGPRYDARLRSVYTEITAANVLRQRGLIAALFDDALADSAPLLRTIEGQLDTGMLADIADAYVRGRLLLVGTADLDAQQRVVWNLGAIAASGHPDAPELLRRLLLASAAIPGAFPPVMLDVGLEGARHQEMHVDGGAFTQAFLYPPALTASRRAAIARGFPVPPGRIYLIRNARLDPEWSRVERRAIRIAGRAVATMIAASGFNDALRIANLAERDGMEFRLAFIGREFDVELPAPFDQAYMRALFAHGYERARRGFDWASHVPGAW